MDNFSEIKPQSMDDNFAKETLDFVNINFTKIPPEPLMILQKKHPNFGKTKKTPMNFNKINTQLMVILRKPP